jgi:hypothetical protein
VPHFETLLDLGPDITPRAAVGDKGYDARANRQTARSRGICPAIPYQTTTKEKPKFFPKALYRGRARIEQTMESSNASSALLYVARKPTRTTPPLSPLL